MGNIEAAKTQVDKGVAKLLRDADKRAGVAGAFRFLRRPTQEARAYAALLHEVVDGGWHRLPTRQEGAFDIIAIAGRGTATTANGEQIKGDIALKRKKKDHGGQSALYEGTTNSRPSTYSGVVVAAGEDHKIDPMFAYTEYSRLFNAVDAVKAARGK